MVISLLVSAIVSSCVTALPLGIPIIIDFDSSDLISTVPYNFWFTFLRQLWSLKNVKLTGTPSQFDSKCSVLKSTYEELSRYRTYY